VKVLQHRSGAGHFLSRKMNTNKAAAKPNQEPSITVTFTEDGTNPTAEIQFPLSRFALLEDEATSRGIPVEEVILQALDQAAAPPKELLPVMMDRRTVEAMRAFCEAADVDADEWAEGWIKALVDDSLDPDNDVRREGITQDLINNCSPDGDPDYVRPVAEAEAMAARFDEIKRKLTTA
jgi:hypothetical protein